MSLRFDEKGKYYTDYVTKEGVPVVIQLVTHHVRGYVYVQEDERLSDELNRQEQFLPVTQAVVLDASGNKLYEAQFLAVNRAHIVWIYPEETPDAGEVNAVEELLLGEDPLVDEEVYQVAEPQATQGVFEPPAVEQALVPEERAGDETASDDVLGNLGLFGNPLPSVDESPEDSNA